MIIFWICFLLTASVTAVNPDLLRIYLCNQFPTAFGRNDCEMEKHPFQMEGLEPTGRELNEVIQDYMRSLYSQPEVSLPKDYCKKSDVIRTVKEGDTVTIVGCMGCSSRNLSGYKTFNVGEGLGSSGNIYDKILNIENVTTKYDYLSGISSVVPVYEDEPPLISIDNNLDINQVQCFHNSRSGSVPLIKQQWYQVIHEDEEITEKIGDYLGISDTESSRLPYKMSDLNLVIDVVWEPWSCCSACCCSEESCGAGNALTATQCQNLESFQSRLGYASFKKITVDKPIPLNTLLGTDFNTLNGVGKEFDQLLSDQNNPSIPIFSSIFIKGRWKELSLKLNQKFKFRSNSIPTELVKPSLELPYGRFGKYVDSRECTLEFEQRKDCFALEKCRSRWDDRIEVREETTTTVLPTVTVVDDSWKESCKLVEFTDLVLDESEESFTVGMGLNYRVMLDEAVVGDIDSVKWQLGTHSIKPYDWDKSCSEQNLAISPDQKSVLILGMLGDCMFLLCLISPKAFKHRFTKEILHLVISASVVIKGKEGGTVGFRVMFKPLITQMKSKFTSAILKWVIIISAVFLALIILISVQIFYEIRLKRKMLQKMKTKESEKSHNEIPEINSQQQ